MDKQGAVRTGVLIVLLVGMLSLTTGLAVADCHQAVECDNDEEDEDPYYDGPEPDVGGAISEFIGSLVPEAPTTTSG